MGFSMGVLVYGFEVGVFLWGCGWFHSMGSSGGSYYGSFGGFRVEEKVVMVLGLGWPRGVGMVRKWKWYPLTVCAPPSNPPLFLKAGQACFKAYEYPFQTNDASVVFANGGGCAPPQPPPRLFFLVRASLLQST